jgi:hypothetical protein
MLYSFSSSDRLFLSRLTVALLGVLVVAGGVASSASANQGGRVVSSGCVGSTCSIRGIRVQISRQNSWTLPSGSNGEAMWVGAQDTSASSDPAIVQDGIAKATTQISGCGGVGTGGSVKTFYYWIGSSGSTLDCIYGQVVSTGENHTFRVQRCNNSASQWCAFIDGSQVGQPRDIGLSTAPWAEAEGEYTCWCGNSSDDIDGTFGGSVSPHQFSATDCGTSCSSATWYNVQSSDAKTWDDSCGGGLGSSSPNWFLSGVDPSTTWQILGFLPLTC